MYGNSIIVLPTVLPTSLSLGEDKQPERTLGTRLKCNIIVINIITVIVIVSILINNYSLLLMLLLLITLRIFFPSIRNNLILRMRFSWARAFALKADRAVKYRGSYTSLATRPSKKCRQICGHSQGTAIYANLVKYEKCYTFGHFFVSFQFPKICDENKMLNTAILFGYPII